MTAELIASKREPQTHPHPAWNWMFDMAAGPATYIREAPRDIRELIRERFTNEPVSYELARWHMEEFLNNFTIKFRLTMKSGGWVIPESVLACISKTDERIFSIMQFKWTGTHLVISTQHNIHTYACGTNCELQHCNSYDTPNGIITYLGSNRFAVKYEYNMRYVIRMLIIGNPELQYVTKAPHSDNIMVLPCGLAADGYSLYSSIGTHPHVARYETSREFMDDYGEIVAAPTRLLQLTPYSTSCMHVWAKYE